jgi:hypothetical protein
MRWLDDNGLVRVLLALSRHIRYWITKPQNISRWRGCDMCELLFGLSLTSLYVRITKRMMCPKSIFVCFLAKYCVLYNRLCVVGLLIQHGINVKAKVLFI